MVDALIYLCGSVSSVQAQSLRQVLEISVDDTISMLLRFETGITGYLGTITATPLHWRMQIFGSKGWAHMRDPQTMDVRRQDGDIQTHTFSMVDIELAELEAFTEAIAGGTLYPVISEQAVHGIAVFEAVTRSVDRQSKQIDVMGSPNLIGEFITGPWADIPVRVGLCSRRWRP